MNVKIIILIACILMLIIIYLILTNISGYKIAHQINHIYAKFENNCEYYDTNYEWCIKLRENYKIIKEEYMNYIKSNKLKSYKYIDVDVQIDDVQIDDYDISDIPWEVLFLRVYNKDTNKIKYFPKTYDIISKIPGCVLATFSVLPGGKVIPPHCGPYKGIMRYHLALLTPMDTEKCKIVINNIPYKWSEGQDVMFNDTYEHWVRNDTDETRVVLILDIKKKFNNIFLNILNDFILTLSKYNNTVKEIVRRTNES